MAKQNEPRPDLDAAIDAVVPSLTLVDDATVADALRRTRLALADRSDERQRTSPAAWWRWAIPTVAVAAAAIAALAVWPGAPAEGPTVAVVQPRSAPAAGVPATRPAAPVPIDAPMTAVPPGVASGPAGPARTGPRRESGEPSAPVPTQARAARPDPMAALIRAAETIPEEAWAAGLDPARAELVLSGVSLTAIAAAPLETPPILDTPAEPVAPGEP